MEINIIRHGLAEELREGLRDEDRALTPKGRRRTRRAMKGLRALGIEIDRILTSPLLRARETAVIVARVFDTEPPVLEPTLAPGVELEPVLARLAREPEGSRIALVGHEPSLGVLASWLATGEDRGIELEKAGVARLEAFGSPAPGSARLTALLPPRVLRRLAR